MTAKGRSSLLPPELLWEREHASEVVLNALADGQVGIVPDDVRAHVGGCAVCMAHLGRTALVAHATHTAVARRRIPRLAVVLGLLAAIVGFLPSIADESPAHALSSFTRALAGLSGRLGSPLGIVSTYVAAGALVLVGLAFARLAPKKEVSS
jgi:hypothetical protein